MVDLPQLVLNGLTTGGIYALGAVGLTLVYGILNLVNFAHGDLLTVGAYVAWMIAVGTFGASPWHLGAVLVTVMLIVVLWDRIGEARMQRADRRVAIAGLIVLALVTGIDLVFDAEHLTVLSGLVLAGGAVAVLSVGLDRLLWTRMRERRANLLTLMIVSIGLAFTLRSTLQLVFGGDNEVFPRAIVGQSFTANYYLSLIGLDLNVTKTDLWILGTTAVAVTATTLVMNRTRIGKAMRALADNRDLARVAGIDTERVVTYVWLLGGALAGIAGMLLGMDTLVRGTLGWRALLPLFAAVILGGVGSVPGALLGGFLIGLAESFSVPVLAAVGLSTSYKVAVGFLVLIVTLMVRPQGIMGVEQ